MKIRNALLAGVQGLWLAITSQVAAVFLFVLSVLSISFILLGFGLLTTPAVLAAVRAYANNQRLNARDWAGVTIPVPYRPLPDDARTGLTGQVERCVHLLKDPATWRDLLWLLVQMTAGFTTALLPAALLLYLPYGYVLAAGLWRVFRHHPDWYAFIPVSSQLTGLAAAALGTGFFAVAVLVNPALLRAHFLLSRAFLAPPRQVSLAQRVERLTETRHDAVDTAAAELRRIERDLHDGAQARLVAVGMSLGTIEALMDKNPEQARKLLAKARESSAEALAELRDLVRGIHPPVLAERGLGDAVRALALRLPIPTEVTVDMVGRADAPVESAAYFAVSEVLTNAAKHSGADRVWVDIHYDGASGMLRMTITDNGHGGAILPSDASAASATGSGLLGIERRLGTFDGVLAVSSPAGGPTMVTMELPCVLFSPKTSSS